MREAVEPAWDINGWIAADPDWRGMMNRLRTDNNSDVFYPVQQDPTGGFPYVRYSARIDVGANTHWMHTVQIAYAMYFSSVADSALAMNIIMDKVRLGDESATALNKWLAGPEYTHTPLFEFKALEWISGGHTDPTGESGGAHARLLTIGADYTPLVGSRIS